MTMKLGLIKLLLVATASTAAVAGITWSVTRALFTDTASVGSNTVATGTIDIQTSPTSALLTASDLAPGDLVAAPITVTNGGTMAMRYVVQHSATNSDTKDLRSSLRLRVGLRNGGACDSPYYNAAGAAQALADDTELYEGLGIPAAATNMIGDVAAGDDAGDRDLAASGSEVLCFAVVLPLATGNTVQGATTTATFAFVGEQTANN